MYSVSIPLGATINMNGAAITITIMAMAAANTMGIQISLPAAILLSVVSALGACGASGGRWLAAAYSNGLLAVRHQQRYRHAGGEVSASSSAFRIPWGLPEFRFRRGVCGDRRISCLTKQVRPTAFMYSKKERQQLGISLISFSFRLLYTKRRLSIVNTSDRLLFMLF